MTKQRKHRNRKHRSHISSRHSNSRPFGKFTKFNKREAIKWIEERKEVDE